MSAATYQIAAPERTAASHGAPSAITVILSDTRFASAEALKRAKATAKSAARNRALQQARRTGRTPGFIP